ncbi:hypothetical protein [Zoogloea sp. LCSB751]|uniref:hypothetical protein n=1 Tax=Zoogloea sp. LCSB751 TaxID=1965277 RepID=UPI0013748434|nr:hypothetical protein [Zoogloea sp. LCSB751]
MQAKGSHEPLEACVTGDHTFSPHQEPDFSGLHKDGIAAHRASRLHAVFGQIFWE